MSETMTIQPKRKVTVFSMKTNKKYVFESSATTYGALKKDMSVIIPREDMNLEDSKVFEGLARLAFESDASQLPRDIITLDGSTTNDLTLIVTPKQRMKSGATLSRTELYAQIKTFVTRDGDKAKNFFSEGKNYTNKGTEELQKLVDKYSKKPAPAVSTSRPVAKPAAKAAPAKKEAPAPVVKKEATKPTPAPKSAPKVVESDSIQVELSKDSLQMIKDGLSFLDKGINLLKNSGILPLTGVKTDFSEAELRRMAESGR